jgi:hypothetical protein
MRPTSCDPRANAKVTTHSARMRLVRALKALPQTGVYASSMLPDRVAEQELTTIFDVPVHARKNDPDHGEAASGPASASESNE